jgi:hypothetical protein
MNGWFRRRGWIYLPKRPAGWLVTVLVIALVAWIFRIVDRHSHSVSDTLIRVVPWVLLLLGSLGLIAAKTSDPEES